MAEVFINYRTGDGDEAAELIALRLSERFGKEHVFKASHSIQPGELYPQALTDAAKRSEVLLAIMGPNWAQAEQLQDEADWVRTEILAAQSSGASVVPVLKGRKTDRLVRGDLPPALRWLADVNSLLIDMRESTADIDRIGDFLADLLPALKTADRSAQKDAAGGSITNSAGDIAGNSVQARDISGQVRNVHVNDAQGPTSIGDNNTQISYLSYISARLRPPPQRLPQPIDHLRRLAERFVAPPGFDEALAAIRAPGTVILNGPPGSGRTAAAQMLVFRSWSGDGRLHPLEPQQPEEGSTRYIDPFLIDKGDGMWADLSDSSSQLWNQIQKELPALHHRVQECDARLVVIQPHWLELRSELRPYLRGIEKPQPRETFVHLLQAEGLADGEDVPTPQSLNTSRSMADIRQLVDGIMEAKDQAAGQGTLSAWIEAAQQPTSPRESLVRTALDELPLASERALLLSVAMLHGAHADVIDSAAAALLARFPGGSNTTLERSPLGDRLREVGAEDDATRHVYFTRSGYEAHVRVFFWRHFPELHDTIARWVRETLDTPGLRDDDREELARGFATQCLDDRYQYRWTTLVEHLTAEGSSPSRELAAAAILQTGLGDIASSRTFRRQIYDWSRARGTSSSLATALVPACQQMAETHSAEALVRLHHLARRHLRRTDIREALAEVASGQGWLLRLLLSRLTGGYSNTPWSADAGIFLDIVTPAFLVGTGPTSRPPIPLGDIAPQLTAGWALVFTVLAAEEWTPKAMTWLRCAAEDDANGPVLVDVLVGGARSAPAILPRLYGLAHRAPFRDVIAELVLTKISDIRGVELP